MKVFDNMKTNIQANRQEFQADKEKAKKDGSLFRMICMWVYKLRSVILSIPVAFAAVIMAVNNLFRLPDTVSLCLPASSADGMVFEIVKINRMVAVFGPLGITIVCLAMVLCSRRVSYPWLISVFSLVLPWFIYFVSVFPG